MELKTVPADITPRELEALIATGQKPVIIDVREAHELEICRLNDVLHIPLGQLPERLAELEAHKNDYLVVHCRSGGRSKKACQFLNASGFSKVSNLAGGILAWAKDIDPSMKTY